MESRNRRDKAAGAREEEGREEASECAKEALTPHAETSAMARGQEVALCATGSNADVGEHCAVLEMDSGFPENPHGSASAQLSQFDDGMISALRQPMTIAQLKRHMDRRFDRLERTKADRRDLRRFATKNDLRRFATKKDLRRFATKKDLQRFATKKDLRRYATKTELRQFSVDIRRHFDVVAEGLEEKLQKVADAVAQIAAVKLDVAHHDKVLDEHATRITALERHP